MSYGRYGRPALKNSVDVQLQTAFTDSNWNTVIRLADKRFKTLKDPYYEAIRIAAESQLDGTSERCTALIAIDELVKSKAVPDYDTLELLEWAARDYLYDTEYAETLGPLRARWVKANPKSKFAVKCLQSCLEYWDLVSAQQIATTLDKAFANSGDRQYMFWSITLTYLLSVSPQCSEASKKVYSLLVVKQLERAADITENAEKVESKDRGLLQEEEISLYYRVMLSHGSKEDFISRMQSPKLGPLAQLKEGRKDLFYQALNAYESWGEWDRIYDLCRQALRLGLDGVTPTFSVCDYKVWKKFALAASKSKDQETALGEVQSILKEFIALKTNTAMYKKNIALALLDTAFRQPEVPGSSGNDSGVTPRVIQIGLYLDSYFDKLSAFDDVKDFVAELSFEEVKGLMEEVLPKMLEEKSEKSSQVILKSLICKLRYLLTTCTQTLSHNPSVVDGQEQDKPYQCRLCSTLTSLPCESCLRSVVTEAAQIYQQIVDDSELLAAIPRLDKDPRIDLALVMGNSILKLSGLHPRTSDVAPAPLRDVNPSLFLQAVLVLDTQLKVTPSDVALRLLLAQLYLLLGCASYAYQIWTPLEVKRTIQDSLSPLFFDRISSLSPGLFTGTRPLMEPLRSYYNNSLHSSCPLRIWDAFSSGSYSSILEMTEFDSKLRRSCTLMMSIVEERRATRAFGGKIECEIGDLALTENIDDTTTLLNKTDYGSFVNLESPHGPPIQEFLRIGPELSNERAHLSFLSEQYLDLIHHKPPKDHRPYKPSEAAIKERAYTFETLSQLNNSLTSFIHRPTTPAALTSPEATYYTIISLLSAAVLTALSTTRADPYPSETMSVITSSIRTAFTGLRTRFTSSSSSSSSSTNSTNGVDETFYSLTDMHTLSHVRETALAMRHSAAFVQAWNDRELARDRSGKSTLHKDGLAELKALDAMAAKTITEVKGHIQKLKEQLGGGGWLDKMLDWTFGAAEGTTEGEAGETAKVRKAVESVVGGREGAEEWVGKVVESWGQGVKGWGLVRME
ncbi:N-acetyltransferase B complex non catalytic subunit-domain-containing protein [Neurospora hispaniola]|uniref:N-acetyltransferase B complex non catalytic subunit-domain-containing protein n=1 Tax=Neurospora hispaniola TaxID=588809 RepID=A0AAJ0I0J0_9PEZI|nr:N-acetyltransferase B complex non catalytic subunit-domain-containing protein [Neurospora hispaniola]